MRFFWRALTNELNDDIKFYATENHIYIDINTVGVTGVVSI